MDTKIKVIIIVFAIVIVFYVVQFLSGYMKKKEHFTSSYYDDVEHYDNPPAATTGEQAYDLRLLILDEIDKLNITDKVIKGKIMETLFSDVSMNQLKGMTSDQKITYIKNVYQSAANIVSQEVLPAASVVTTTPVVATPKATFENSPDAEFTVKPQLKDHVKALFENSPVALPGMEDYFKNSYIQKEQQIKDKMSQVMGTLADMKELMANPEVKVNIPELPKPPLMVTPSPAEEKSKPVIEGFANIDGFEAVKQYANY